MARNVAGAKKKNVTWKCDVFTNTVLYPIRVGLLKCFTARGTSTVQRNQFDSKWRAGRSRMENTFGILKNKWSILKKLNCNLKYEPTLITACCILHNFCIGTGDMGKDDELDNEPNSGHPEKIILTLSENKSKNRDKIQREALFREWTRKHYVS
jgi:hypothetical protein